MLNIDNIAAGFILSVSLHYSKIALKIITTAYPPATTSSKI